jgi:hypothetical protein
MIDRSLSFRIGTLPPNPRHTLPADAEKINQNCRVKRHDWRSFRRFRRIGFDEASVRLRQIETKYMQLHARSLFRPSAEHRIGHSARLKSLSRTVNFKTLFIGSGRIEIRATRKTGCATAVTGGPAVSLAQTCSYNCGRARGSALKDRLSFPRFGGHRIKRLGALPVRG